MNSYLNGYPTTRMNLSSVLPPITGVSGYQPLEITAPKLGPTDSGGHIFGMTPTFNGDGKLKDMGWGGTALQLGQALFSGYLGMKQYGLMKDQLAEGKRQFAMNFDAQRRTTNASLADRQAARLAADPTNANGYQSVGDYMKKYGIQGG